MSTTRTRAIAATAVAAALIAGAVGFGDAQAAVGPDSTALRDAVTVEGITAHLLAFQAIADDNDGNRQASTPGYFESVDYVAGLLDAAGYDVDVQEFLYPEYRLNEVPTLSYGLTDVDYETEFWDMDYSDGGEVSAPIVGVDLHLDPPRASDSGCEAADFVGFPSGSIALIQRGTCTFLAKVLNAQGAGASAVIIFNQGDTLEREALFAGTLAADDPFADPGVLVPVLSTSFALGATLASFTDDVTIDVDAEIVWKPSSNVIAETPGGRADRTVVVGAHLDSVEDGPGINDNGSGSATILETALQMAALDIEPRNKVRFAFWGAEESGLLGSTYYVQQLTTRERKNIALNLNFDMLGSPNYVRFVYDGDGSSDGVAGPNGSGVIEKVFLDYFGTIETEPTSFDGRSDYGPFIAVGIPAGGLFSGAEGEKTAEEAAIYGGTIGDWYDPCYHEACDTFTEDHKNISNAALDELGDAAVHAILTFAQTTSAVNGTGKASAIKKIDQAYRGSKALK